MPTYHQNKSPKLPNIWIDCLHADDGFGNNDIEISWQVFQQADKEGFYDGSVGTIPAPSEDRSSFADFGH